MIVDYITVIASTVVAVAIFAMSDIGVLMKSTAVAAFTAALSFTMPIYNFLTVIAILATCNFVVGWLADEGGWSFKKACNSGIYLCGYFTLLILTNIVGRLMNQPAEAVSNFISWVTWVMIYFYTTNILRNWNIRQPDNKVIAFLYWVASVKFIEKIHLLSEYMKEKQKDKNV